MWWFAAAHANLLVRGQTLIEQHAASGFGAKAPLLDAGCGTGGLLKKMAAQFPNRPVIGLDADPFAAARAKAKSKRPVCVGSVNALPFDDAAFAAIFSADVLCHRNVDEVRALRQFHRCLGRGGLLVLNLPAYRWMLSRHDIAVANVRRYSKRTAIALLRDAGFRLVYATYWNAILFPLMVITRKLLPSRGAAISDVALQPALFEAIGRMATAFELTLLRYGVRLPFGGSLLAVAVKEDAAHA